MDAIDRGYEAMLRRDWAVALQSWETVQRDAPDHIPAYLGAGHALQQLGRLDEAQRAFEVAAARFPDAEELAIAAAFTANARRDPASADARWSTIRQRFPHNLAGYLGSISALRDAERWDDVDALLPRAEAAIVRARANGRNETLCLQLELEIAKHRADWSAVRRCGEQLVARMPMPPAKVHALLAEAYWHHEDFDAAAAATERALDADPQLTQAAILAAWVAVEQGDGPRALHCYRRLAALQPEAAVRWSLKVIELLNWLGRIDEAVAELESLCARRPDDRMIAAFLRHFGPGSALARSTDDGADDNIFAPLEAAAPAAERWRRPIVKPDPSAEVQMVEVPGATTVLLAFTGAGDGVSMPLSLFDRYLAPLRLSVVYLKDFHRLMYLRGIRSLGADYADTLAALRATLARLQVERLVTLGNCDGASAAIRYGVELGAERMIAMSPVTRMPGGPMPQFEKGRRFKKTLLTEKVPVDRTDLLPLLQAHPHHGRIDVYFREEVARERGDAERVAVTANVRLHPLAGSSRSVLHRLALASDDFGGWLAAMLGFESAVEACTTIRS